MGSFNPGSMPGGGNTGRPDSDVFSNEDENTYDPGEVNEEPGSIPSETAGNRPSSFSGMSGRSSDQTIKKNLMTYGICLVVLLAALAAVTFTRRRR